MSRDRLGPFSPSRGDAAVARVSDNAAMEAEGEAAAPSEPTVGAGPEPEQKQGKSRGRLYGMRALVVLATLLLILGALAVWVKRVALEPGTWSDTSGKVLENQVVRQTLATYLVDQLYANVDVAAQIRAALPERAKPLAAPAAAGLQDSATRFTERALARPRVQQAWRRANEEADRRLIAFVEDDSGALRTSGGNVTLDLRQILQQVGGNAGIVKRANAALANNPGVADRINAKLGPNAGQIVLLRSNELSLAQQGVRSLKAVANFIVIIVLLIFALAIWIAPNRRRAVRACAIGLLVAGLVLVFIRRVAGDQLIDHVVKDDSVRPAAHEVWWIATDPLEAGHPVDSLRRHRRPDRCMDRGRRPARHGHAAVARALSEGSMDRLGRARRDRPAVARVVADARNPQLGHRDAAHGECGARPRSPPAPGRARVPARRARAGLLVAPGPRAALPAGALGRGYAARAPHPPR